jgi:hypothetical protein
MKCEMCGYEFEEEGCKACGKNSCGECRCPACGTSTPPPSKIASFLRKIRRPANAQ